ncbi:MAG: HEAT repeat domain-containing protein, partial [Planctomycetes bacterium]|nr:HEAT repeat domain-containing protein [Planctomycetota bacterium]
DKSVLQNLLDILPNEQIDASVRERLADSLINFCAKSATPYLLSLLPNQDIDPMVRGEIARSLGRLGDKIAIPGLLDMLLNEAIDSLVGWRIGHALEYLWAFPAPKALRALLDNKNIYHSVKWVLAKTISNFDPTAYPEFVEWISDESLEQEIRLNVALRLGNLNLDDEAIKDLQRLYSAGSLPLSIRASVGVALLQLGERQVADELKVLLVHPEVNHYYVKVKIAEALVERGEKDIASPLLAILRADSPPEFSYPLEFSSVRLRMADLLAKLGDSTVAGELLEFLRDEQVKPHIRVRAADALNALDLSGLTTDIKTFISDPAGDALVRGRAAFCLAQDENGVAWLVELIAQDDIQEEVYAALRFAARQANVRVFAAPDSGYEVVPLQ